MDVDVKTADEYFESRLGAESWFELNDTEKNAAITTALNKINRLPFIGTKLKSNQDNAFPRVYGGEQISMPADFAYGVFEEAYSLVVKAGLSDSEIPDGIQSLSLGSASVTFKDTGTGSLNTNSMRFLNGWLKAGIDIDSCEFREVY